jgi:hypothetical protein
MDMASYFNGIHCAHNANAMLARSRSEAVEHTDSTPFPLCVKETSPFIAALLYRLGAANLRLHQKEGTQETLDKWILGKEALRDFDHRWKAAGELAYMLDQLIAKN